MWININNKVENQNIKFPMSCLYHYDLYMLKSSINFKNLRSIHSNKIWKNWEQKLCKTLIYTKDVSHLEGITNQ